MPSIVTNTLRVYNANSFINSFQTYNYNNWLTATVYAIGDVIYNSNYKYIAETTGTSGATPPTHVSGSASDGGVSWLAVEAIIQTGFFENNLYLSVGKKDEWRDLTGSPTWDIGTTYNLGDIVEDTNNYIYINELATAGNLTSDTDYWEVITNDTPDTPVDNYISQVQTLSDIISAKRLEQTSVNFAIKRYDWLTGTVYDKFDPEVEDFEYTNPFYVMTDESNIYKCLNNNGGIPSTAKPTGTFIDPVITSDSYVWQYMATVSPSDAISFLTSKYIPIEVKLTDDGSPQWNVQQNAKPLSVSSANIAVAGTGYTSATATFDAPTSGVTAEGTVILIAGEVVGIQITNVGTGYLTTPNIVIAGDGSGAIASSVMAPKSGHGANVVLELNGRYVTIHSRFDDEEAGYFPIDSDDGDFRQLTMLVDPKDTDGNVAIAQRYIGPEHEDYVGDGSSGYEELMQATGEIMYIENIEPVFRSSGQIEDVKITLKF